MGDSNNSYILIPPSQMKIFTYSAMTFYYNPLPALPLLLKIYLEKSAIVTRRNTSVIIFLLLKAIGKIEDSAEGSPKNITNNAKRSGQNNNRSLSTRLNKTTPIKTQ